jgi:hypothetical protein
MSVCKHCQRSKPYRRGLCQGCHGNKAIRDQYPAANREMTEAELDRLIEERRAKMPRWWNSEPVEELA